jgi:hypothetical protein
VDEPVRHEEYFTGQETGSHPGPSGDISSRQYRCTGQKLEQEAEEEERLNGSIRAGAGELIGRHLTCDAKSTQKGGYRQR